MRTPHERKPKSSDPGFSEPGPKRPKSFLKRFWWALGFLVTRGGYFFLADGALFIKSEDLSRIISNRLRETAMPVVDGEAYRRLGAKLSHPENSMVDGVLINSIGRFGNSIIQLGNALEIARTLGSGRIRYFRWDAIRNKEISLGPFQVSKLSLGRSPEEPKHSILWRTQAFRGRHINFSVALQGQRSWLKELASALSLPESRLDDKSLILTIHLRSGDVFHSNPHPDYGQPPFSFYRRVLEHKPWDLVRVLSEDNTNPCLRQIQAWCDSNELDYSVAGTSLPETISILRSSAYLAIGTGTFVPSVQLLDDEARTFYVFGKDHHPLLLCKGNIIFRIEDITQRYVSGVMSGNWSNTPEQRELMKSYPIEALSLPRKSN